MKHTHGFAVDAACDCGMMLSQLIYEQQAEIITLESRLQVVEEGFHAEQTLRRVKSACLESAEKEVDELLAALRRVGEALERMYGLVESTAHRWQGALPHGDNVSTLVLQDRISAHDAIRKAAEILHVALAEILYVALADPLVRRVREVPPHA